VSVKFYNLEWLYEENGKLYKFEQSRKSWNGKAEYIQRIEKLLPGVFFKVKLNSTQNTDFLFSVGLSNSPLKRILYPDDFKIAIIIKGSENKIVFRNYFDIVTEFDVDFSQENEIKVLFDGEFWKVFLNDQEKGKTKIDFQEPIRLQVLSYWNKDYPIDVYLNLVKEQFLFVEYREPSDKRISAFTKSIKFLFNKLIDESSVKSAISILDLDSNKWEYEVNDNQIIIHFKEPLKSDTEYKIVFNENLKAKDGSKHKLETFVYQTFTKEEEIDKHFPNVNYNPLDVYFQARNIRNLIDIDRFIKNKNSYDFVYTHTEYLPEEDKYIKDGEDVVLVKNSRKIFENFQKQFLYNYDTYAKLLENEDLITFFLKRISFNNIFRGSKSQIQFIVSFLGHILDHHVTEVDEDPYKLCNYRINSTVPYQIYKEHIEKSSNIVGYKLWYFEVPEDLPFVLVDRQENNFIQFTRTVFSRYCNYYDVQLNLIDKNKICKPNLIWTYRISGNTYAKDLDSHKKYLFTPNKYNAKAFYDSMGLDALLYFQNKYQFVIDKFESRKSYLNFKSAEGIGLEYYWEFWDGNVKVFEIKTNFSEVNVDFQNNFKHYNVILRLQINNWVKRIPLSVLLDFRKPELHFTPRPFVDRFINKSVKNNGIWLQGIDFSGFKTNFKVEDKSLIEDEFEYKISDLVNSFGRIDNYDENNVRVYKIKFPWFSESELRFKRNGKIIYRRKFYPHEVIRIDKNLDSQIQKEIKISFENDEYVITI